MNQGLRTSLMYEATMALRYLSGSCPIQNNNHRLPPSFPLLSSAIDSDDIITQHAQVREIDWDIYKYVGVSGVDRQRIVQVGNALAFEEQGLLANSYSSPVMTAVLAAFGESDLLSKRFTSETVEIRSIFDSIMSKQLTVQASLADVLVSTALKAGWSQEKINLSLQHIAQTTPIDEIQVASMDGKSAYSSNQASSNLRHYTSLVQIGGDVFQAIEHAPVSHDDGSPAEKSVTVFNPDSNMIAQVTALLSDDSMVSPNFKIPE